MFSKPFPSKKYAGKIKQEKTVNYRISDHGNYHPSRYGIPLMSDPDAKVIKLKMREEAVNG